MPGITSAVAVPAYAGIPSPSADSSTSFTVVTGHEDPGRDRVDWEAVARLGGTLVILMGVARAGIPSGSWPAGSPPTPRRRPCLGAPGPSSARSAPRWADLGDHDLESPVGDRGGRRGRRRPRWFEDRPLFGRTVVVTRAREQASELVGRLRALGAETVEVR